MINKLALIFLIFFSFQLSAQNSDNLELDSVADYQNSTLFNSEEILRFDLKLNTKAYFKDVDEERKYHWAEVTYKNSSGNSVVLETKVKSRGNYRRSPQNCNFPPLKLKIPKKVRWDNNLFSGQSRLKLVVPCIKNKEKYEDLIIKEYLAYKIYNLLTEQSYKVRLVKINLIDSAKNVVISDFVGFFIEETKQMAKRNNGKTLKLTSFHQENINREQMTQLAVFQYLIGNTDWSISGLHNIKLLFEENSNVPVAVPYDFDWCGLVNAPYAKPAPQIGTTSVRLRVFRGYKRAQEEYEPIIKQFNSSKAQIYNLCSSNPYLSEKSKKDSKKYLDEFYKMINDPKQVKAQFIKGARK